MKRRCFIGRWAAVLGAALMLPPGLPAIGDAAREQIKKPQVVDMGNYRLSFPSQGKWQVFTNEEGQVEGQVMFAKSRGETAVSVLPTDIMVGDWQKTEGQAAEFQLNVLAGLEGRNAAESGMVGEKGETVLKDKKLYYVKFQKRVGAENRTADVIYYLYFPPPIRKLHMFFSFMFYSLRPKQGPGLGQQPDLRPVHDVIDSLEIADPLENARGPEGELIRAAATGDADAVRRAIGQGTNVNARIFQFTALSAAAFFGHMDSVGLLLENGAEINAVDKLGNTALHWAITGNEPEIAARLIESGADVNLQNESGLSALMLAVGGGHPSLVSMLVERGADVNARTEEGETAVWFGTDGSPEILRLLISKGAEVNSQIDDGWTPLMQAVFRSNAENAKTLLDAGANVNLKSVNGYTALMAAISPASAKGDPGLVELLIGKGADLDAPMQENGQTALLQALITKEFDIARMLVEAGANVNSRTKSGMTPLMAAARAGHVETVKILIERGAEVNAVAEGNTTALKIAREKRHSEIVELLQAAGAK